MRKVKLQTLSKKDYLLFTSLVGNAVGSTPRNSDFDSWLVIGTLVPLYNRLAPRRFNDQKKYTVTLKFTEALAIHLYFNYQNHVFDHYSSVLLESICRQISQQLSTFQNLPKWRETRN